MKHLIGIILALILFVAAVGGYVYLHQEVRASMDAEATARAEGAAAEERERHARAARSFLSGVAAEQTELATYVATDADFLAVIETIEAAARREKVTLAIGSVSVGEEESKYHEQVAVVLSAEGTFANVARFASALETLPFASKLVSASFEKATGKSWFLKARILFVKRKP